eukprot:6202046-Pleurochrysis_carterae.AAC.1
MPKAPKQRHGRTTHLKNELFPLRHGAALCWREISLLSPMSMNSQQSRYSAYGYRAFAIFTAERSTRQAEICDM